MEYVIIGACIVVAIAGGIVLYVKNKRTKNELGNTAVVVSKTSSSKLQASEVANDPVIQIGILPADAISDETKLVEITDSKVLAHINNLVPGLAQAGNAANNATQAVKANGEVLYRAIIPAGAKLTDSKAMEGAVRGFYHGADGIRGHANLVAVEAQKGTAVAANTAAAAMGVASMIVGQYYMTQINAELGVISDGISQIQNFQDNEYRSRVFSLVAHVKKMTSFKAAQLVAANHDADKVVFLVDRKELGIQSLKEYRSFATGTESVQATENTDVLISKLKSPDSDNTLIVTSIQKLSNIAREDVANIEADLKIIQRKRMVIIIDECHRSTFGDMLVDIKNTFKNALIFGFTGTPIQDLNAKKDSTTPTIFGDEIHRYTLGDGIRDKNVLGFDPYMVRIYDDADIREKVALSKAKAKDQADAFSDPKKEKVYLKYMDSSQIKMHGELVNGKYVKGIEDFVPNEQYQTDEYVDGVIQDIKKKWTLYSRNRKFHAIFATSSIPEAVKYYRLMVKAFPDLFITAMFDPTIDNEGGGSLEKEDGIVEILEAYNKHFNQKYTIPTYDKFRKEVSLRLGHKKPFDSIGKDEQIDILIVVNQMLTGFDSKFVNTLYLDKMMEYENLIQG